VESRDGELELVVVGAPRAELRSERVVSYRGGEAEDAGIGREFRLLVESSEATQFIGVIPPGRAKMHNHPYDELAWLVEGEGLLHWHQGESVPVSRGSRIYFPRLVFHSLENTRGTPMRIMGVFHPAGSPADRVEVLDY
jgi:mannose-6-phosphate isomerase-like protein (cupin superfamily)